VVAATEDFTKGLSRVVVTQLLLTLLLAAGFFVFQDRPADTAGALAACYGGAVTIAITLWMAWWTQRTTRSARGLAAAGLGRLYLGNFTRYALAIGLLAIGLGVLKLAPLPLVVAFAVTQFGYTANIQRK
jgi:ATP synthase protein I